MCRTEEKRRLCVGVDLHKTQFTVCAVLVAEVILEEVFRTEEDRYRDFGSRMHGFEEEHGF